MSATLQVLQTVACTRADHGGTSRSIPALCDALCDLNVFVQLVTAAPVNGHAEAKLILPRSRVETNIVYEARWAGIPLRGALAFRMTLERQVKETPPHILHDHGAWLPSNYAAASIARGSGIPLLVSPRGMLTHWAFGFKQQKKRLAWHLYQHRALARAAALHATSYEEAEDLRALGLQQPIAIIPNGVELPDKIWSVPNGEQRTVLFFSRIHPKKGLVNLVRAWAQIRPAGWRLVIAGPDEAGHQNEVEQLVQAKQLTGSVHFLGSVADRDKWEVYRQADLFVLPTFSENFGIVVAEALASGIPVITTHAAPWKELQTHRCGWWIDLGVEPLSKALLEATQLTDDQRLAMGSRGRVLVEQRYSWPRMAEAMREVYEWMLGYGPMPSSVLSK